MNKIGTDVKCLDGQTLWGSPLQTLSAVHDAGLDGVLFRTLDELSPTLDTGELKEFSQRAAELDLYVEMGVGKVNPYMTAELPRIREIGQGSYLAGMELMLTVCAENGWTETWTAVGGFKRYPGIHFTDRFRPEAPWPDQLRAITAFLKKLRPTLLDTGVHLNLETHEEITTFEMLRIIEEVGDDVLGVCLDPANLPVRAEPPLEGLSRIAPYVRMTQLRDAVLWRGAEGIHRFLAPVGEGIIDWDTCLATLLQANPSLNFTIEGAGASRVEMMLHTGNRTWREGHPDLTQTALDELTRLAAGYEQRAAEGAANTLEELRAPRPVLPAHNDFVARSAAELRKRLAPR